MRHHLPVSRLIPPPATLAGVLNMLAGSQDTSLQRLVEQRLTVSDRETCWQGGPQSSFGKMFELYATECPPTIRPVHHAVEQSAPSNRTSSILSHRTSQRILKPAGMISKDTKRSICLLNFALFSQVRILNKNLVLATFKSEDSSKPLRGLSIFRLCYVLEEDEYINDHDLAHQ